MSIKFILSDYVEKAMETAVFDKLEDGSFSGRIPLCKGVIALDTILRGCEKKLQSVLEDWLWLGLKLGHPLPVIGGIDLNKEPKCEPMDTLQA